MGSVPAVAILSQLHPHAYAALGSSFRVRVLCHPFQFVILAAYDHTDPDLPVEERVALGLKRCGVSVTCKLSLLLAVPSGCKRPLRLLATVASNK